ncbi:DUF2017 family protein [Herbihabitans rhizosphaerae]|nr:DUF2017 family protein [Herbihabitans rhizosphaerae]
MQDSHAGTVCWDRTPDQVVGVFRPRSVHWLRRQLDGFRRLLEWRHEGYTADETSVALGLSLPEKLTDYPPLAALLEKFLPLEDPEPLRLWWEPDVVSFLYLVTEVTLESLPDNGGVVTLDEREVDAWTAALPSMRIVYAIASGVWQPPEDTSERGYAQMPPVDPEKHEWHAQMVEWLAHVVDGLTDIAQPEPAEHH